MIDPTALKAAAAELLSAVGQIPRSKTVGYQGPARPLRLGVYFEFEGEDGKLYVVDNQRLASGELALREWVTIRGGKLGGRETVKPGGSSFQLGGVGVGGLLRMLASTGLVPGLGVIGTPTGTGRTFPPEALLRLVTQYLSEKLPAPPAGGFLPPSEGGEGE